MGLCWVGSQVDIRPPLGSPINHSAYAGWWGKHGKEVRPYMLLLCVVQVLWGHDLSDSCTQHYYFHCPNLQDKQETHYRVIVWHLENRVRWGNTTLASVPWIFNQSKQPISSFHPNLYYICHQNWRFCPKLTQLCHNCRLIRIHTQKNMSKSLQHFNISGQFNQKKLCTTTSHTCTRVHIYHSGITHAESQKY